MYHRDDELKDAHDVAFDTESLSFAVSASMY